MNVIRTTIPEVLIFEPKVFGDERGFFFESFNHKQFFQSRREFHERCNGPPGSADAPGFKSQGNREQKGHRRRLKPFADSNSSRDRDNHQQVHVGRAII